jgi:hypothetical protein
MPTMIALPMTFATVQPPFCNRKPKMIPKISPAGEKRRVFGFRDADVPSSR